MYKEDVFVAKEESINSIIQTFKDHSIRRISTIPYLEERLYLLEILLRYIEYESALEVIESLLALLDFDAKVEA